MSNFRASLLGFKASVTSNEVTARWSRGSELGYRYPDSWFTHETRRTLKYTPQSDHCADTLDATVGKEGSFPVWTAFRDLRTYIHEDPHNVMHAVLVTPRQVLRRDICDCRHSLGKEDTAIGL